MQTGDKVVRMLAGTVPMDMVVTKIENGVITCAAVQPNGSQFDGGWTFDEATGAEIDHELSWGPQYGATGSFLKLPNKEN